jgi:hypothetical protein
MDEWDKDYIDEEEPAHIEFEKRGIGHFHFGYVDAQTTWQYDDSLDRVDFTFEGMSEGDEMNGRGWAKVEGKQMEGKIVFHSGDDSGFKARKAR